jgi:glycosyltransferase involved in cell wall biosynthesis
MRLLHITAGAGGMYCGSCLRDNALAAELLARRHEVLLLPVYTPTLTDETNVSDGHVFFGGISVYLEQHVPLLRNSPAILDRLWDAASVIKAATGRGLSVDPDQLGALTVSTLKGEEGFQAKEFRKLLGYLDGLPPFDLVVLPNSLLISMAPALKRALGRPVVCTLQGEDLFLGALREPYRSESMALIARHAASVDGFVATSAYYAEFMAGHLGLDRRKVHAVPLGIKLEGHQPAEGERSGPFVFGYFARVAPEKGLHLLAEAYRILRQERGLGESRLAAAGYLAPEHRGYLAGIAARFREWGLEGEFRYHGVPDRAEKIAFLQGLDALSVPSPYAEPKGLYLLEALANGIPCVQPRHGAFPEVLARTGGGLLFEPNDPQSLADQLLVLASDREAARALGHQGAEGVRQHHSVARMADRALEAYASVIDGVRS